MRRAYAIAVFGLVLTAWVGAGCKSRGPRTPQQLRAEYAEALRKNNPDRAYDLLSPEVQATISRKEYRKRWAEAKGARKHAIAGLESIGPAEQSPVFSGTTVHPGGRVLTWERVGNRYHIVSGLPGLPDTSTPAQAIRAFVAAVRMQDVSRVQQLLGDDLATQMREDWDERVEAIERALAEPGAVELSLDMERAELRYDGNRAIALEQTPQGWRITRIE